MFKYPRSIIVAILTGLSSTGAVGVALWGATLLMLVLKVTPAEAAYLSVWIALIGIPGRALGAWLSDALGRRWAGFLLLRRGCVTMLVGYLRDVYLGSCLVSARRSRFLFIGIETRGRTIEELDAALARPVPIKVAAG